MIQRFRHMFRMYIHVCKLACRYTIELEQAIFGEQDIANGDY